MALNWDYQHLTELRSSTHNQQGPIGAQVQSWAQSVTGSTAKYPDLEQDRVSRVRLREICQSPSASLEVCFLSCMAWGGMNRRHGRLAWASCGEWIKALAVLKSGGLTREAAYQSFADLRAHKKLPGVGPAYFTKLMYFLRPEGDSYIMDQWTGKSIQLLTGAPLPHMTRQGWITDANGGAEYEQYCQAVDSLATELHISGQEAEERIFSVGGKKPGEWRAYVKKQWRYTQL